METRAVGANQLKLRDVPAEGTRDMMVFAMDIVRNCSTQGYIFRSRGDRQKESARHGEVEYLCKGGAGFGRKQAGLRVELDQTVHSRGDEKIAVFQEADIAVTATHANRKHSVMQTGGDGRKVTLPMERDDLCVIAWVTAPGLERRRDRRLLLLLRGGEFQLRWWCGGRHSLRISD